MAYSWISFLYLNTQTLKLKQPRMNASAGRRCFHLDCYKFLFGNRDQCDLKLWSYICSLTVSSLIHPHLPSENQVPHVQNEAVELQTNLMNNPIELLFKLNLRCMKVSWSLRIHS